MLCDWWLANGDLLFAGSAQVVFHVDPGFSQDNNAEGVA
jgi:hypothetical protein